MDPLWVLFFHYGSRKNAHVETKLIFQNPIFHFHKYRKSIDIRYNLPTPPKMNSSPLRNDGSKSQGRAVFHCRAGPRHSSLPEIHLPIPHKGGKKGTCQKRVEHRARVRAHLARGVAEWFLRAAGRCGNTTNPDTPNMCQSWTCRKRGWSGMISIRRSTFIQWIFQVPLKGGRWHIFPQLAVYTTYIPLIYCLLGGYIIPTTLYRNLKNPLIYGRKSINEQWPEPWLFAVNRGLYDPVIL